MIKFKMVTVELEAPRWVKRITVAGIVVFAAIASSTIVKADVAFDDFKPADTLTAKGLNDRFNALKDATNHPTVTLGNGVVFGTSGKFLGPTPQTTDGAWKTGTGEVGYRAGKLLCEKAFGPSAHVCSGVDMTRSIAAGTNITTSLPLGTFGWVNQGSYSSDVRGNGTQFDNVECWGFTSNITNTGGNPNFSTMGPIFGVDIYGPQPSAALCGAQHPILCCD